MPAGNYGVKGEIEIVGEELGFHINEVLWHRVYV